jgi:hypothetical protein
MAKNFVLQTGQVRASGPGSLPGSSTDPPDSTLAVQTIISERGQAETGLGMSCCDFGV